MPQVDVNRRSFIIGGLLTRRGRAQTARFSRPWGVSPPWLSAAMCEGACRGCGRPCGSACEQGIIEFHPEEHADAGTPYLNFYTGGCTFCEACVEACPANISIDAQSLPLRTAILDEQRCLAWSDVICLSCKGLCPEHAIVWDRRMRPGIDAKRCSGCGGCVGACPAQAIDIAESSGTD